MKKNKLYFNKIVLLLLLGFYVGETNAGSEELVKGFAKYQAGRVENIILDGFMEDLANNSYLKKFFPNTSANIKEFDGISGKRLIPLLGFYFDKDLESLNNLYVCVKVKIEPLRQWKNSKTIVPGNDVKDAFKFLDTLLQFKKEDSDNVEQFFEKHCSGITVGLINKLPLISKTRTINNRINDDFFIAVANVSNPVNAEPAESKADTQSDNKTDIQLFSNAYISGKTTFTKEYFKEQLEKKGIDFYGLLDVIDNISQITDDTPYAVRIHHLAMAMDALGFQIEDRRGFQKFKSASLFLASLVEASDSGDNGASSVEGVIKDYVDEDQVYKNKRNPVAFYTRRGKDTPNLVCNSYFFCKNTWFLGSYYGVSSGQLDDTASGSEHQVYRAFGPVGIEFKLFSGAIFGKATTVTFMYAPIDIGVYVTDELKSEKYDVSVEDISAPSYFVSFSSKNSPMSVQLGYQGDIPVANSQKENMYFMSFSFDLPLFTIW